MDQPMIYRINKAILQLGLSRSTIYRLVAAGDLELVRLSARASGITSTSMNAYVQKCRKAG